jgi:hypothetical protein
MSGLKRRGLETERHTPPRQSPTLLIPQARTGHVAEAPHPNHMTGIPNTSYGAYTLAVAD